MADFDSAGSVFKSRPKALATLMGVRGEHGRLWRPEELAAIFRHQLSAPVMVDLGGFDPGAAVQLKIVTEAQGLLLKSFSELFEHPTPPLELLEATKNFAKLNLDHPESCLPGEIAAAIYYTSIAAALVRLNQRITQLPDADVRRGLLWVRGQDWVDGKTRVLLDQALEKLSPAAPETKSEV
jgi:hypothetical protein